MTTTYGPDEGFVTPAAESTLYQALNASSYLGEAKLPEDLDALSEDGSLSGWLWSVSLGADSQRIITAGTEGAYLGTARVTVSAASRAATTGSPNRAFQRTARRS